MPPPPLPSASRRRLARRAAYAQRSSPQPRRRFLACVRQHDASRQRVAEPPHTPFLETALTEQGGVVVPVRAQELLAEAEQGRLQLGPGQDGALRLMAMLERTRRLSEGYSEALLGLFAQRAGEGFARALGVPDHTARVFCESEIRASVVFQLSKLCTAMLKATRAATGASAWDAIVSGSAEGTLVEVDRIVPGALPSGAASDQGLILLVRRADGDEEVTAAGEGVRGVILCQELPHLSHLGVRARQESVAFATCEDSDTLVGLKSMVGQRIRLDASAAGVQASLPAPRQRRKASTVPISERALGSGVDLTKADTVVPLDVVEQTQGGAKSSSCGVLLRLAAEAADQNPAAAFKAPRGVCFPYGTMEHAVQAEGRTAEFNSLLER
ncbi:2,3-dihydroxyphenylpropionate/2,3-dihydroxicinnamic acid 1,2-dioxygenase, partial [Cymbomonas tetramitiformis]